MPKIKEFTIYDFLKEVPEGSKRLVKTDLKTLDYQILDYLKQNALGAKNKKSGKEIMRVFGFESTAKVRQHIKRLRVDPTITVIIGSDNGGYWLTLEAELHDAIQYKMSRTISEIETLINMYPRAAPMLHAIIGSMFKKVDKVSQGQMQIKFNGWENDFINYYADKYLPTSNTQDADDALECAVRYGGLGDAND